MKGSEVAARLWTGSKWVGRELARHCVEPAIGRAVCRLTFYRRDEVEAVITSRQMTSAGLQGPRCAVPPGG